MGTFGGGLAVGMSMVQPSGGGGAAIPDVTVATFADLPTTRPDGYLVAVTAQSGLTEVIVRWDDGGGVWLLEQATCAYSVHSATEWATAGEWYDTGGITVISADGARIYDTTYDTSWRWDEGTGQFVPPDVYDGTIVLVGSIVGDSATPAGWVVTDTDAGGTASITTDGTKVTLSSITSGAGTTVAGLILSDASLVTATRCYLRALVQVTALTKGTNPAASGMLYLVQDGTKAFDFGSTDTDNGVNTVGGYWNAATGVRYTQQSGNQQDLTTTETLLEFYKLGNKTQVRAGGSASPWQSFEGTDARAAGGNSYLIQMTANRTGGTSTATSTIRQARVMRY